MRLNIHYKIMLVLSVTVAIILSGIYFYLNINLKEYAYQRIRGNLLKNTSLAKIHIDESFLNAPSPQRMDDIADEIGQSLTVRVTIIDLDGTVLGDSELSGKDLTNIENHLLRPEIQDALHGDFGESRRFSTTVHKEMLYIARLFGKNQPKGFIRLSIPLSDIEIISGHLKKLLLFSLFFAFIAAIILGSAASVFISRPIKAIAAMAKGIASGDYSKRVSVTSNDEIGDLAKAINYMSVQINARIEEVISNKSRFKAVLLSMCEGTMVVDKKGHILLMNQSLQKLLHLSQDPVGQKPLEVIRNIEIQEMADKVLRTQTSIESEELSVLLPDETILQIYAAPVLRGNELDGAVLVFHDITKLRRLEHVRRDFIANVSHEIRTPLTSIKGYAETLLDGAMNDVKNAKDFLHIISDDSNRLVQLVDDLLDLSRIESGKLDLKVYPCHIEPIIKRVVAGLKKQAKDKTVTIKLDLKVGAYNDIPSLIADEKSIAQVFLNFVDNAIKYNHQSGSVTISAKDYNGFVRFDISDTGIGIPAEDLPRIFERFYRVDKARSRELGGTGLGLSIVKHIVAAHKGEVFVESELGKGSTFSFTLPKA